MNQRNFVPGLLLIGLGTLLFLVQATQIGGEAVVAILGACFLVAYAFTSNYGFLVPGGILTGLGVGILWVTEGADSGGAVLIGLGLGFGLVALVDLIRRHTKAPWWPLIPGGILATIGVLLEAEEEGLAADMALLGPVVLIVIGAVLLVAQLTSRSRPMSPPDDPPKEA